MSVKPWAANIGARAAKRCATASINASSAGFGAPGGPRSWA